MDSDSCEAPQLAEAETAPQRKIKAPLLDYAEVSDEKGPYKRMLVIRICPQHPHSAIRPYLGSNLTIN